MPWRNLVGAGKFTHRLVCLRVFHTSWSPKAFACPPSYRPPFVGASAGCLPVDLARRPCSWRSRVSFTILCAQTYDMPHGRKPQIYFSQSKRPSLSSTSQRFRSSVSQYRPTPRSHGHSQDIFMTISICPSQVYSGSSFGALQHFNGNLRRSNSLSNIACHEWA